MADLEKEKIFVFCDFDGTITATESLEAVFREFLPGKWEPVKKKLIAGETTLRQAVPAMIEAIESEKCPEIARFVSEIPIRPGFSDFLNFLENTGIPMVIVSGGVRKMVEIKLGELLGQIHDVVAVDVDASGPYLSVHSAFSGGSELVDKAAVIDSYGADVKIVVGDGITDFNMARHADLVFARDSLAKYLERKKARHVMWEDFTDIRHHLEQWLIDR